jgi:hypothetical protein
LPQTAAPAHPSPTQSNTPLRHSTASTSSIRKDLAISGVEKMIFLHNNKIKIFDSGVVSLVKKNPTS